MMKNIWMTIMIFAAGLAIGYAVNQVMKPGGDEPLAVVARDGAGAKADQDSASTPKEQKTAGSLTSEQLFDQALPNASLAWLWVDVTGWRKQLGAFDSLWKDENAARVLDGFASAFPQGATEAVSTLASLSDAMRLYLMPPRGESHETVKIAAFSMKNDNAIEALQKNLPGVSSEQKEFNGHKLTVLKTPLGEWGAREDGKVLWLCNDAPALAEVLDGPPPPGVMDRPPAHHEVLGRFPSASAALFINQPGLAMPGPLAALAALGAHEAACVIRWPDGKGCLTAMARVETPPPWVDQWLPMDSPLFSDSDPAGLLELAFRRAPSGGVTAATGETGNEPSANASQDLSGQMESASDSPRGSRGERGGGREGRMRRFGGSGGVNGLTPFLNLAQPGQVVGVNLFGFYEGAPAIAFAVPSFSPKGTMLDWLDRAPSIEKTEVEINHLPGAEYRFPDDSRRGFDLSQLLAVERDSVMYMFDSETAARHYFGEVYNDPGGKMRRDRSQRDFLNNVKTPSQARMVISSDLYQLILDVERNRLALEGDAADQFDALVDAIHPYLASAAVSAGYEGKEWFLDFYTNDEQSQIVETLLLGLGAYRLFYH
ncbi:MAG: hypothetical protein GC154_20685 [bacterium]|nr:hypothetical protein [bacterium]